MLPALADVAKVSLSDGIKKYLLLKTKYNKGPIQGLLFF